MKSKSEAVSKSKNGGAPRQARESGELEMELASDAIPREQMIAVAAYYRAEQRGFAPGEQLSDWLDAEGDVERMLESEPAASSIT